MKRIIFLHLLVLSFGAAAQVTFEKGYIVRNDGQRIECMVKDVGWENNPTKISYKENEMAEPITVEPKDIREFGIGAVTRYVSASVKISWESDDIRKLNTARNPVLSDEQLFLKVITAGKASLYKHRRDQKNSFFYSVDDSPIQVLIYKEYLSEGNLKTNNDFRNQLWKDLRCLEFTEQTVKQVDYKEQDLSKYIKAYNQCMSADYVEYKAVRKIGFSFSLLLGVSNASLSISNTEVSTAPIQLGAKQSLMIGFRSEFIVPVNRNKWTILLEPTYHSYNNSKEQIFFFRSAEVDYKTIQIPVGVRYYIFMHQRSTIFLNALYVFDIDLGSRLDCRSQSTQYPDVPVNSVPNAALGAGYKFRRIAAELRYYSPKEITGKSIGFGSSFKQTSLLISYQLR